jgi:hypothetical protein
MLWYKGWLETRIRVLVALGFGLIFIVLMHNTNPKTGAAAQAVAGGLAFYWAFVPLFLAGAGIRTQPSFQATKGLHGSMYFTLSMPISRFRLLAVRATLGMFEAIGVIACVLGMAWLAIPILRMHSTVFDLLAYWVAASACVSGLYFLYVLLGVFLDEMWRVWASIFAVYGFRWLLTRSFMPTFANLFQAMGASSPLFTHTFPWASMGLSLGIAAILFLVALKAAQTLEY